jgi:cyclopropane fatty-acyl-phospholipid synthase-like methyltransferase
MRQEPNINRASEYQGYQRWKSWGASRFGSYEAVDAVYFKTELARCGATFGPATRVLELGFGSGSFAGWATDRGCAYFGLELIEELVVRGRQEGYRVASTPEDLADDLEPASIDLIVAFDVFEHLSLQELRAG